MLAEASAFKTKPNLIASSCICVKASDPSSNTWIIAIPPLPNNWKDRVAFSCCVARPAISSDNLLNLSSGDSLFNSSTDKLRASNAYLAVPIPCSASPKFFSIFSNVF